MVMSLLTDKSYISILSGKRSFELDGYEARNFPPNFKRPKVDAIRQFPRNCGALARQVSETCNGGGTCVESATENSKKIGSQSDSLLPVKLSLKLVPNELKFEAAKPLVSHGEVPLKNVEMGSPIAWGKVELEKVGANDTTDKQIDTLGSSETSFQLRLLPRKYPRLKIRRGVSVFRDFPQGCGRLNHDLSSKCEVLPNGKSAMEQQPLVEMIQLDKEQIRGGCHDDGSVFARKVEGKLMEDINEPVKTETGNGTDVGNDKLFEEAMPSKSELKQETDIKKCSITSSSSSNLLQTNLTWGKVELEKIGANDTTDKQIDTLGSSETSFQLRLLPRKYPRLKIRKGVSVFRDFPQGCGRLNHDLSSKCEVLPNGKSAMEQRPLVEMIQLDNEQIRGWCHDDGSLFARKVEGKLLEDIDEPVKTETGNGTDVGKDKPFEEAIPSKSELKQEADIKKISITSSSSSTLLQTNLKCQMASNNDVGAKSQVGRMGNDSEKYFRYKLSDDKTGLMMHSFKIASVDSAPSFGGVITGMQQGEKVSDCASTEATGGCKDQKYELRGADGFKYLTMKQEKTNASKQNFAKEESLILGVEAGKQDMGAVSNNGRKHGDTLAANESNDLSAVSFDSYQEALSRNKVRETLNLYEEILEKQMQEEREAKSKTKGKVSSYVYVETAMLLKEKKMWIHMNERVLGVVPGVQVGDQFYYRAELVVIGLHHQFSAGIDYMEKDGKKIATSIVASGRYSNDAEFTDVLNYSGEGGNPAIADKKPKDQKLVRGNLALKNSMDEGTPVRVIRGRRTSKSYKSGDKKREKEATFTYDGLYIVSKYWQDRAQHGKLVYMFQLVRMQGQPKLTTNMLGRLGNSKTCYGRTLVSDISYGKEKIPIRVVNGIDNEKPPSFNYITNMLYPQFEERTMSSGCDCVHGCLDYVQCSCVIKNRGTIPFNENGAIFRRKPVVYECGPSCKCPPSCNNRISQHGLRFQLEVFKTESRGWGVRSRNFISSGSFICEYVGELLNDEQAEERSCNDEYLFDIGIREDESNVSRNVRQTSIIDEGFAIDAGHFGNVGRFVNHCCSPNLYSQNVLFDHDDKMMPHVMLFAMKNIPPLQELTYDYNYKIGQVHDANGNVRRKTCFCGAHNCIGRMY